MKGGKFMAKAHRHIFQAIAALSLLAQVLTGCATLPQPSPSARIGQEGELGRCADFFAALDQRTVQARALDAGSFRVSGYPYLRTDRFLASFRWQVQDPAAFAAWVDRMQALDREARRYEIANLSPGSPLAPDLPPSRATFDQTVEMCGDLLKAADFQDIEHQEQLRQKSRAPDDYIELRRVLGLYPIAGWFVSRGVAKWHEEAHRTFSLKPPQGWQTTRYAPQMTGDRSRAAHIVRQTERDAMGLPLYSAKDRQILFQSHAPVWEVETLGDDDRIGSPFWDDTGDLAVDIRQPVTFTLLSFTRFGSEALTQLNYIIWFPSRPKQSAWDIYGGALDGLNLRVTLDNRGEPLLYETIHNCGCYYEAYPTRRLNVRESIDYAEPPLIFAAPEFDSEQQLLSIAMEGRTHYVQHLYPTDRNATAATATYALVDYGLLRSLPYPTQAKKSMFAQDGIAHGSERLERFILWPMGVLSPGGMRQWGRHAIAFVGERQFDDPFYMDQMFTR
jgi:hypothetical protein